MTKVNISSSGGTLSVPISPAQRGGAFTPPCGKGSNLFSRKIKGEIKILAVFAVLVALFYGNTLQNGFVHDDIGQIVQNKYIQSLEYLPKVITGCPWEGVFGTCQDAGYYRPLQNLSYLMTYQISSQPWAFHLANLIYFLFGVFLVFILVRKLTKSFLLSFLTSFFFLIHPINSEAVNWVAAVPELLLVIFVLSATIFFIKYRQEKSLKNLLFCYLFYFLAIFAKEPAISLPLIFLFLDWKLFGVKLFQIRQEQSSAPETPAKEPALNLSLEGAKNELLGIKEDFDIGLEVNFEEIKKYFGFAVLALIYFLLRLMVLKNFISSPQLYFGVFSPAERIYAFFSLFSQNLGKLFYPFPLLFFHYFEKRGNLLSLNFFAYFLVFIAFFAAIYFAVKKRKNLLALFMIWFFIFLWPVLFFIYFVGENVFSERYLCLPSIGFAFIIAYSFCFIWQKRKARRVYVLLVLLLITAFCWQTIFQRNKDYKNDETIYRVTLAINPRAYALRRNLAVELMDSGRLEEAKAELDKILASAPETWWEIDKVYNQMGDYYRIKGDFSRSKGFYEKNIAISGTWNYKPYNNLGALFLERGELLPALPYLCKASQLEPEAKEVKANFERVVFLLSSVANQSGLKQIYAEVVSEKVFKKSGEERIRYLERNCEKEVCSFVFSSATAENEVLLPFLIMAINEKSEVLKISRRSFDPQRKLIGLELPIETKDKNITFIFPSCQSRYFQVLALPNLSLKPQTNENR